MLTQAGRLLGILKPEAWSLLREPWGVECTLMPWGGSLG